MVKFLWGFTRQSKAKAKAAEQEAAAPLPQLLTASLERAEKPSTWEETEKAMANKGLRAFALQRPAIEREQTATPRNGATSRNGPLDKLQSAIELDEFPSAAYSSLGAGLGSEETVTLRNGEQLSGKQLHLRALEHDSTNSEALNYLGSTLTAGGTMTLPNGQVMTKRQLYLQAIHFDASSPMAYGNLGTTLAYKERVTLLNGQVMDERALHLQAISLSARADPQISTHYSNLATTLEGFMDTILLPDGYRKNRKELYLKAIELDSSNSTAYSNLGTLLKNKNELVHVFKNKAMGENTLYMTAIEIDRSNVQAWKNLSNAVGKFGMVQFPDGKWVEADYLSKMAAQAMPALARCGLEPARALERSFRFKGMIALHN